MTMLHRIMDLKNLTAGDRTFLQDVDPKLVEAHGVKKRSRQKPIGPEDLPVGLLQDACRFLAQDYCCLNFVLPEACDGIVTCQWVDGKITALIDGSVSFLPGHV